LNGSGLGAFGPVPASKAILPARLAVISPADGDTPQRRWGDPPLRQAQWVGIALARKLIELVPDQGVTVEVEAAGECNFCAGRKEQPRSRARRWGGQGNHHLSIEADDLLVDEAPGQGDIIFVIDPEWQLGFRDGRKPSPVRAFAETAADRGCNPRDKKAQEEEDVEIFLVPEWPRRSHVVFLSWPLLCSLQSSTRPGNLLSKRAAPGPGPTFVFRFTIWSPASPTCHGCWLAYSRTTIWLGSLPVAGCIFLSAIIHLAY